MSFLEPDRFHRAARDGHLDLLQEANRKELNSRDEDGMTPAMWAAYYGHLDALRLIVGRGGDPDKCDHYGNTCLHCAAGNGHTDCVSFLIHFGVNLWALDNDFHTAKDVAAINQKDPVLRLLDQAQSKHTLVNRKLVQRLKEKSVYDAEKRVKQYRKMQTKAAKRAEKEDKQKTHKDTRYIYAPKFSDIVNATEKREHSVLIKPPSVIGRKKKNVVFKTGDTDIDADTENRNRSKTIFNRSSTGILCPTTKESDDGASSPDNPSRQTSDAHSSDDANSDVLQTADSGIGEELPDSTNCSIFDRPGFGTVAFRNSVVNLSSIIQEGNPPEKNRNVLNSLRTCLQQTHRNTNYGDLWSQDHTRIGPKSSALLKNGCSTLSDSIGSASSLVRRHITWEDECDYDDADDDATDDEDVSDEDDFDGGGESLSLFLTTVGLAEYIPLFQSEQIDLESLTLLSEDDFKALGMPLGPRRKLEKAIQQRIKTMQEPGIVQDSRL